MAQRSWCFHACGCCALCNQEWELWSVVQECFPGVCGLCRWKKDRWDWEWWWHEKSSVRSWAVNSEDAVTMKRSPSVEDATITNRESENDVTMKKRTSEDATINRESEDDLTMKKKTSVKDATIMNKTSEDDVTTVKKKTKTEVTVAIESSFTDLKSRRTLISAAVAPASPCSEGAAIVRKRRSGTSSVDDCLSQGMQEYKNLRQQKIANACAFCLHQCHESPSTLQTCYAKTSTPSLTQATSTCPT